MESAPPYTKEPNGAAERSGGGTNDKSQNDAYISQDTKLFNYFRNQERLTHAESAKISHGAFGASLQGQPLDDNKSKSAPKPRKCLCGEMEEFKNCPYINEKSSPIGWKGDQTIQNTVDEKIKSNPKLKHLVKIREETKKGDSFEVGGS